MSIRHEFPTNREMVIEFGDLSHELFKTMLERMSDDGFHPGLLGKPISALTVEAKNIIKPNSASQPDAIANETATAWVYNYNPYAENEDDNSIAWEKYSFMALTEKKKEDLFKISRAAISIGLDIRQLIQPETVIGEYHATDSRDNIIKYNSTDEQVSNEGALILSRSMLEGSIKNIQHSQQVLGPFNNTFISRCIDSVYTASLEISLSPHLPLNGAEPKSFTQSYIANMRKRAEISQKRLESLQKLKADDKYIEKENQIYDQAIAAMNKAKLLIK